MFDIRIKIISILLFLFIIVILFLPTRIFDRVEFLNADSFISNIEAKTFDLRQKIISKYRKVSDDIVIISLDNGSFEFMTEQVGHWPMPRSFYVDMIDYVESYSPKVFSIGVTFTGAWKNFNEQDTALANKFKKYDNLFTGLFFDDYSIDERKPVNIPDKHSCEILDFSKRLNIYKANNFRQSYEMMLKNGNLGHVNLIDYEDGIYRTIPMFISYPMYDEQYNKIAYKYYPNLSLKILSKIVNQDDKKFVIDKHNNLIIADKKIPLTGSSEVVLNWYQKEFSNIDNNYYSFFKSVPFKDVYVSIENIKNGKKPIISPEVFNNKIVLFGFTAEALFDINPVPVEKYMPGIELHAVFINNFLDNSFIKKFDNKSTIVLSIFLLFVSIICFYLLKSPFKILISYVFVSLCYIFISYILMGTNYLWLPIVLPCFVLLVSMVVILVFNYFVKSKDYEKLYTLVNVDDLTGLYNKRFFNEHMDMNIKYSLIYDKKFSLIIIDIDHFKKFNDTYGHLSGDCVLKQVAQILKKEIDNKGVVCRYGGEEMCVILPQIENNEAHIIAQHLCNTIAKTEFILVDNIKTNVTISLGVSVFPDNATTIEKLVEYADKGLYYAKEHGRNQVGKSEE